MPLLSGFIAGNGPELVPQQLVAKQLNDSLYYLIPYLEIILEPIIPEPQASGRRSRSRHCHQIPGKCRTKGPSWTNFPSLMQRLQKALLMSTRYATYEFENWLSPINLIRLKISALVILKKQPQNQIVAAKQTTDQPSMRTSHYPKYLSTVALQKLQKVTVMPESLRRRCVWNMELNLCAIYAIGFNGVYITNPSGSA